MPQDQSLGSVLREGHFMGLSVLQGTQRLFGSPPAPLVSLWGRDTTCAGLGSHAEAARPGHALEHMGDQQGSVVLGHTLAILFVGLWAHTESPPSSKVLT